MTRRKQSWLLSLAIVGCLASGAVAAPRVEKPDSGLTEGLDNLLRPAPQAKPGKDSPSPWAPNDKLLNDLIEDGAQGRPAIRDLGEDLGKPSGATLEGIEESMDQATELIGGRGGNLDRARDTAQVQRKIIADLDELIKQAEKQCSNCSQSQSSSSSQQQSKRSQPKPSQGKPSPSPSQQAQSSSAARDSQVRLGQAAPRAAEGRSPDELMKEVWGHLPQRVREQMLQSGSDEFLPRYKEEIEAYFKRLAEEEASR